MLRHVGLRECSHNWKRITLYTWKRGSYRGFWRQIKTVFQHNWVCDTIISNFGKNRKRAQKEIIPNRPGTPTRWSWRLTRWWFQRKQQWNHFRRWSVYWKWWTAKCHCRKMQTACRCKVQSYQYQQPWYRYGRPDLSTLISLTSTMFVLRASIIIRSTNRMSLDCMWAWAAISRYVPLNSWICGETKSL